MPKRNEEDEALGGWVVRQRSLKNKDRLPRDREEKLGKLGFVWSVGDCREQDQTRNDEK